MDINFNVTVDLTVEDVKQIVTEHLEKKLGKKVTNIDFDIQTVSKGYGVMEHDEKVLTGCKVKMGD